MDNYDKVVGIISSFCSGNELSLDTRLRDDLSIDSLNMVLLLIQLEDVFGITLKESDLNPLELKTVNDIVNLADKYTHDK